METTSPPTMFTRRTNWARRIAPLAAGALMVGLSSCGSGGPEALTLTPGGGLSRNAAVGAAGGASADKAMGSMTIANITYKVEGTLPDLGDSARAWRLRSVKSSSVLSKARKIAAELGITDKFVSSAPDKNSYTTSNVDKSAPSMIDGAAPNMWVYTGETESSWSYFAGNEVMTSSSGGAVAPCEASKDGTTTCVDPAPVEVKPPRNLPTTDEALARATEVIEAAGEDIDGFTLTATKDQWGTYVQATMKLGDIDGPYAWWFGFGADKALTSASGTFVSFARAAQYPLVPTTDAVERLQSGQFGYGLSGMSRSTDIAASSDVAAEPAPEPTSTSETEPAPKTKPAPNTDPATIDETMPTPEPIVVTITGARLSLMSAYLADGRVVILPAYTFTNADGDVGTVYAIEDKYLKFDDGSSAPKPGDGGDTVVPDDSGSGGGSAPVSPGDPTTDAPIDQKSADTLVGLSETTATEQAEKNGWIVRVAQRDGESFMLTADFVGNRVNLTIESGTVTVVVVG